MMTPMPTQLSGAEFLAARRRAFLWDQPRVGKEQPIDAQVMTPHGPREIGALKVGDVICDTHSGTARVQAVCPQGIKQAYRVTFRDGTEVECGIDHLWTVYSTNRSRDVKRGGDGFITLPLREIMERGWLDKDKKSRFRTPTAPPTQFLGRSFTIEPYTLGVLLGDGCLSNGSVSLSIADRDADIAERVALHLPSGLKLTSHRTGPSVVEYRIARRRNDKPNDFLNEIRRLGLDVLSGEKFIPVEYLYSTTEQRLCLLNGLMDTDGHCAKNGETSSIGITRTTGGTFYHTKSLRLAKDVLWLVRSLGGVATLNSYERKDEGVEHRIVMQMGVNPFLTPFKASRWKRVVTPDAKITRAIVNVEPSRVVAQVCIKTSAPDGLYLTNDFIVTHNTGAAILAADYVLARTILVITTASGRGVWRKAFPTWSAFDRKVRVLGVDKGEGETEVAIVSWGSLASVAGSIGKRPDLIILDEDQRAVTPSAKRTEYTYGRMVEDGKEFLNRHAIVRPGDRVWHLSGLPMPHNLSQAWSRMRSSFPERLRPDDDKGWPDVTCYSDFCRRYTVTRPKRLSNNETIQIVMRGQNVQELRARLEGTFLRRTQRDVGIQPPRYELMPLIIPEKQRAAINADPEHRRILEAAEAGETRLLDVELGTLRRVTGTIKAAAVVEAVKEEFANGVTKLVLAYWHRDVGDVLQAGLKQLGVLRLDGSTSAKTRETLETDFRNKNYGVFLAQIKAAGEAIDLSAANEMWCVEVSSSPGDMDQVSKRIVNVGAQRPSFIRVVTLAGTIDEALQAILMRLWAPIKEVLA